MLSLNRRPLNLCFQEDYGGTFEKSIDAMPPVDEKFVVDEKIPTTTMTNATMKVGCHLYLWLSVDFVWLSVWL